MSLVELRNVSKIYHLGGEEIRALDGVSLDIEAGEFISIIGPSGSGKSTLMHILGCLDTPSQGSVRLDGVEIARVVTGEAGRGVGVREVPRHPREPGDLVCGHAAFLLGAPSRSKLACRTLRSPPRVFSVISEPICAAPEIDSASPAFS